MATFREWHSGQKLEGASSFAVLYCLHWHSQCALSIALKKPRKQKIMKIEHKSYGGFAQLIRILCDLSQY